MSSSDLKPPQDLIRKSIARNKDGAKEREQFRSGLRPYGISFIDDATGGLAKDDLVLLAAYTGIGKTQLATLIAANGAYAGDRVVYFALEAHENEIEWRLKYREVARLYYSNKENKQTLTYRNWLFGDGPKVDRKIEGAADGLFELKYATLSTCYPHSGLTPERFQRAIETIKKIADRVVIDHLHYFDIDTTNENRGITDTMKAVRHSVLVTKVPHILVCQLRKESVLGSGTMPTLDSFHGSSNIPKIATVAISISRLPDECHDLIVPTYCRVLKYRRDGSVLAATARMMFDVKLGEYLPTYELGKLTSDGFQKSGLNEKPYWAKNAI